MGALEDITAEIEAKAAEEVSTGRYASLLENLPAVVYEMDPDDDRRTRYVNRKIEELLGYTMEEWLDQPDMWTELLHPDDRERRARRARPRIPERRPLAARVPADRRRGRGRVGPRPGGADA